MMSTTFITFTVLSFPTGPVVNAKVTLKRENVGDVEAPIWTLTDDFGYAFFYELPIGADYSVKIEKEGFYTVYDSVQAKTFGSGILTEMTRIPGPCFPTWGCEIPLNGYEMDSCGNRRANERCNPPPPICQPSWKCEVPANGYEFDGCGNIRVNLTCNPLQIGNIGFVSNPPGAEIFIDGKDQGVKTPKTLTNVPAGSHTYAMKLAGYQDAAQTITVTAGQTTPVGFVLAPISPSCIPNWQCEQPLNGWEKDGCGNRRLNPVCNPSVSGSISISSTPPGAKVFFDGEDQLVKTPVTITDIPAGEHTYRLVLKGYREASGSFTIEPGKTTVLTITPEKLPSSAGPAIAIGVAAVAVVTTVVYVSRR